MLYGRNKSEIYERCDKVMRLCRTNGGKLRRTGGEGEFDPLQIYPPVLVDSSNCTFNFSVNGSNQINCPPIIVYYEYGDGTIGTVPYHTYKQNHRMYTVCITILKDNGGDTCYDQVCTDFFVDCPCNIGSPPIDDDTLDFELMHKRTIDKVIAKVKPKELIVNLYPNPASEKITIQIEGLLLENWKVDIVNDLGQKLIIKNNSYLEKSIDIPIGEIAAGHYTAIISKTNGESAISRISFLIK